MPEMPTRPPPIESSTKNRSSFSIVLAFMAGILGVVLLAAVLGASLLAPSFGIVAVLGILGIGLFIGLHYIVWGRWLMRSLQNEEAEDSANRP